MSVAGKDPVVESLRQRVEAECDLRHEVAKIADSDDGIGGDELFCEHGNLLWSEDCDECDAAFLKLSDEITNAAKESTSAR